MSSRRTSLTKGEENLVRLALADATIVSPQPNATPSPANVANLWLANWVSQPGRSIGYSGAAIINANSAVTNSVFVAGCVVTPVSSGRFRVRVHGFITAGAQAPNITLYLKHAVNPNALNALSSAYVTDTNTSNGGTANADFTSALMVAPAAAIVPCSLAVDYAGNFAAANVNATTLTAGPFAVGTPVAFFLGAASALVANNASTGVNGVMIEVQEIP